MSDPIGVLDSGIGGLTVAGNIARELPFESLVYIGDSRNTPYGRKSPEEIYRLSERLILFLLEMQVKVIVIACNTITVSSIQKLRENFPDVPIVGTVPVVKTAATVTKNKRIGILSTTQTANSDYQKELIATFSAGCVVINRGTDDLVPLIEQGNLAGGQMEQILGQILAEFKKNNIDTLALGCTHFPLIRGPMQEVLGEKVQILDSGPAIARQVKRILTNNRALSEIKNPVYEFYTTGNKQSMKRAVMEEIGMQMSVTSVDL